MQRYRSFEMLHSSVIGEATLEPHLGDVGAATAWLRPEGSWQSADPLDAVRVLPLSDAVSAPSNTGDADTLKLSVVPATARLLGGVAIAHGGGRDDRMKVTVWGDAARTDPVLDGGWQDLRPAVRSTALMPFSHPGWFTGRESDAYYQALPGLARLTWGNRTVGRIDIEVDCRYRAATLPPFALRFVYPGLLWQPPWGIDWDGTIDLDSDPDVEEAEGGYEWADPDAPARRVARVRWPRLGRSDALQDLWDVLWKHRKSLPVVVSLWPDDALLAPKLTFLARVSDHGALTWRRGGQYPADATFRELK